MFPNPEEVLTVGTHDGRCWIEQGTNQQIALMLACPGWFEEFHGRPAAGDVAQTLDILLRILRHWSPRFPVRDDLTITNATSFALWESRDGRSLPTHREIKDVRNLDGLQAEIGHIQRWLICFGDKAILAGTCLRDGQPRRLHRNCEVIEVQQHLTYRGLARITRDLLGQPIRKRDPQGTRKRLAVIADQILRAMGRGSLVRPHNIGSWPVPGPQRGRF
jgi:hypothetical protein